MCAHKLLFPGLRCYLTIYSLTSYHLNCDVILTVICALCELKLLKTSSAENNAGKYDCKVLNQLYIAMTTVTRYYDNTNEIL